MLEASRNTLCKHPAGENRLRECFHPPDTEDIRMEVLNALAGSHGVESFETHRAGWCDYLNMGDPYVLTLIYFRGRYSVACWGDIAERYGAD